MDPVDAPHGFLVVLPADPTTGARGWPRPDAIGESSVWFHGHLTGAARLQTDLGLDTDASSARIVEVGLRRWPDGTAEHITGEYAAVVVRGSTATLIGDRMGLRPLYIASLPGGTVVVSTDLGALARETRAWHDLDEDYLADMFSSGLHLGAHTPYSSIRRLRIGEYAEFAAGRLRVRGGWRPRIDPIDGSFDDHQRALRTTVENAVAESLSSTRVPAAELSGGLDTSTVLAVSTGITPMHAVSFVHPEHPGSDETAWMRAALDTTPAVWHPINASAQGTFAAGPELGCFLPTPSRRILNWAPAAAEEEVARQAGISTLLTGEGGDAVFFAGLLPWYLADLLRAGRMRELRRQAAQWGEHSELGRSPAFWVRRAAVDGVRRWRNGETLTLEPPRPFTTSAPWLNPAYVDASHLSDRAQRTTPIRVGTVHGQAVVENILRGAEFARSRHIFGSAGPELRHPLLAPAVVDLAMGTPWHIATDPRIDRAVQRYAFAGLVSETVLRRRSKPIADEAILQGFERYPRWADYLGTDPQVVERGYVDVGVWRDALRAIGRIGRVTQLYTAIQIEVWLRHLPHAGAPALLTDDDVATAR
ncbi:asparagine synthase-related protein [Gordonia crocea]|uniref:asparagine synthase (glutamine-hydrolyzing) n=1 Tax=Gordonia crocea TaxID=589162 RepID=A0A7I9UVV9_9ACTN|nr:asparagine synthase-related protein [Gordonia crocea]GED97347.1 asparagine synthase [Gordonia crocea]